jgi:uncharacterized protein
VELSHSFVLPLPVDEAWAQFQDIGALAECFPGATVTSADDEGFAGSVKVKLGPIALVYNGAGTFVERDVAAHRMVIDAKGKDKRGNGTAGAHVVLVMSPDGDYSGGGTRVEVGTDLSITGKPAQFGRGVMQDVSDKLLGQFVACLEQRHQVVPEPTLRVPAPQGGRPGQEPVPEPEAVTRQEPASRGGDALDLGSAALPVLARTYGPWLVAGLVVLLALRRLLRR